MESSLESLSLLRFEESKYQRNFRLLLRKIVLYALTILLINVTLIYTLEPHLWGKTSPLLLAEPSKESPKNVVIYTATMFFTKPFESYDLFVSQCPDSVKKWCRLSSNPDDLPIADAVLFHNSDFNQSLFPKNRNLNIPYIGLTLESPSHTQFPFEADQINLTMNYRPDSDVYHPYFIMKRRSKPEAVNYEAIWNMKNHSLSAAWRYKFYFSFENSNCPSYITEKIYNALALYSVIPIVIQRRNYENFGIPSNAFIALDDFDSIKSMVEFMQNLENNKTEYLKYFKWRENYEVKYYDEDIKFCNLCKKLQQKSFARKSYKDLKSWYSILFQTSSSPEPSNNNEEKSSVLIFTPNKYFGLDMAATPGQFMEVCPKDIRDYCRITSDINELDKANAVLWHLPDHTVKPATIPYNPSQIQVMLSMESPHYYSTNFKPGFINWTMTYRADSDIHYPYGNLIRRKGDLPQLEDLWTEKNHSLTAAWMVANCETANKRKELVETAQKRGLNVDILGSCGKKLEGCDRMADDRYECAAKVLKKYKFYFALENTNCKGYVTEKFFNSLRLYNTVPIVIRRKDYEEIGIPSNSFIAIDDFDSMAEMVKFLNRLKSNSVEYLKYHEWRKDYEIAEYDRSTGYCQLCEKLKEPITQTKNYVNLQDWFSKGICDNNYADSYLAY